MNTMKSKHLLILLLSLFVFCFSSTVFANKAQDEAIDYLKQAVENTANAKNLTYKINLSMTSPLADGDIIVDGKYYELMNTSGNLPDSIRVAALHGKMKPAEKNNIMEAFSNKEIDVLVSTTVIEVGINVPNATVMMVENAERFGLAQLHQLRGRVGRGDSQSYCIFISGNDNEQTMKRLNILNTSNDGFHIANEDLKLRGPGDLFGIRQSGLLDFKVGDIYQDSDLLLIASSLAERIAVQDPDEKLEQYSLLYERMKQDGNSIDFKTI